MDFWIIRDGEKAGPFPDYEVRSKISTGELVEDSRVWHEGLSGWTKLSEMELFAKEFPEVRKRNLPPELPKEFLERAEAAKTKEEKSRAYLARRFWARWLDLTVYASLWWLGMYLAGQDIAAALQNPWLLLPMYVPWFMLEALMIHKFGRTPGKWMMGIRVVNEDESGLSLKASIWRSVRVMVTGIGFGWGLLSILCQAMSWFTTRRVGKPIWDFMGQHKLVAEPHNPLRIIMLVFLISVAFQLQMAVRGPHVQAMMIKQFPQFEELLKENGGWYFPVKK